MWRQQIKTRNWVLQERWAWVRGRGLPGDPDSPPRTHTHTHTHTHTPRAGEHCGKTGLVKRICKDPPVWESRPRGHTVVGSIFPSVQEGRTYRSSLRGGGKPFTVWGWGWRRLVSNLNERQGAPFPHYAPALQGGGSWRRPDGRGNACPPRAGCGEVVRELPKDQLCVGQGAAVQGWNCQRWTCCNPEGLGRADLSFFCLGEGHYRQSSLVMELPWWSSG